MERSGSFNTFSSGHLSSVLYHRRRALCRGESIESNFNTILMPLLCAYGMVFGRSMRMLDLSIGSRIIASSMIGGIAAMNYNLGIPGFVLVTVVASVLLGAVCGLVFRYFKIPSIVVSLVIAMIFEVIGAKVTDGMGFLKLERDLAILEEFLIILLL